MNEEQDLKLTDLDYLTGNHHLQMMKAALPYMEVPEQRMLSVFVKINELQRTISLFRDEEVASMGICSLEHQDKKSPVDMLKAIKPYAAGAEQDMIELIGSLLQSGRTSMANMFQSFAGSGGGDLFSMARFFGHQGPSQPGMADPKMQAAEIPDSEIPGSEIPVSEIPGFEIPGSGIPGSEIPDSEIPGSEIPDSEIPSPGGADSGAGNSGAGNSEAPGDGASRPILDQLKGFLSPEQQTRIEMVQMMIQAMQQFT